MAGFGHHGDVEAGLAAIFELQLARYEKAGWWRLYRLADRRTLNRGHREVLAHVERGFADRVSVFLAAYQARGLVDPAIQPESLHLVWTAILDGIALRQATRSGPPDLAGAARKIASILSFGLANRGS
jgi:hypothetical protein